MISKETIKELQDAIQEECCHKLSDQEAREIAVDLVGFFDVLAQIDHQDKLDTGGNQ